MRQVRYHLRSATSIGEQWLCAVVSIWYGYDPIDVAHN